MNGGCDFSRWSDARTGPLTTLDPLIQQAGITLTRGLLGGHCPEHCPRLLRSLLSLSLSLFSPNLDTLCFSRSPSFFRWIYPIACAFSYLITAHVPPIFLDTAIMSDIDDELFALAGGDEEAEEGEA